MTTWIEQFIDNNEKQWKEMSDFIWDHPEVKYEEHTSASYLVERLEEEGFRVQKNIAEIETAFVAEVGSGSPVIAFLGEYDALPQLSQEANVATQQPIEHGGNGHGCGHNLLGVGALAAATALKRYVEEHNIQGTVRFYGCPAEEGGSGKTYMARAGVFDDVDLALTWHPGPVNVAWTASTLANVQASFKFKGKSAHAAASPHLGRSALDAVELMNVGANYLREHVSPQARFHYAVTNTGGASPNVVQAEAEVLYLIRAPHIAEAQHIYERIQKIAEGAALMTETAVEVTFDKACSNFIPLSSINKVIYETMQEVGAPTFTEEEMKLAEQFYETLTMEEKMSKNFGMKQFDFAFRKPLSDVLIPYFELKQPLPGSTDVGDVSWVAPTGQCIMTTCATGTPFHSWQLVAQGKTSYAHKGMMQVAKVLANVGLKAIQNEELLDEMKREHQEAIGERGYICPIPAHIHPNGQQEE